jgi:hypothetical protein
MPKSKIKKVTIIHADGRPDTIEEMDPSLERLQKFVAGYIELIPGFNSYKGQTTLQVLGNEEGKLMDLPINRMATLAWRQCDERITDQLVGDIVVIQAVDPK